MRTLYLCMALAAVITISGCSEESTVQLAGDGNCVVRVEIAQAAASKAIFSDDNPAALSEGKVSSLEVFIFSDDGTLLIGHDRKEGMTNLDVTCKSGQVIVAAVANAPELSRCTTLESLENQTLTLQSMRCDNIVMFGLKSAFIEGSATVLIDVSRQVTRVVIRSIENRFALASQQVREFRVKGIYLINVQGENNFSGTAWQGSDGVWYNKMKNETSPVQDLIYDSLDEVVPYGETYDRTHCFYALPNDFEVTIASLDAHAGAWSRRYTRLVVEASLDGERMYYPVTFTSFCPNVSYEIDKLVITKTGSSNPDIPVDSEDVAFSLNVKPWEVILLGDDGIVTI